MSGILRKEIFLRKLGKNIRCHLCGSLLQPHQVTIDHVPAKSLYEICQIPKAHRKLLPACKKCNCDNGEINAAFIFLNRMSARLKTKKFPMPLMQWEMTLRQEKKYLSKIGSAFLEGESIAILYQNTNS